LALLKLRVDGQGKRFGRCPLALGKVTLAVTPVTEALLLVQGERVADL